MWIERDWKEFSVKHGALGLCSLFTFKQAFGQLQQIRRRNGLKTLAFKSLFNRVADL